MHQKHLRGSKIPNIFWVGMFPCTLNSVYCASKKELVRYIPDSWDILIQYLQLLQLPMSPTNPAILTLETNPGD